MNKKRKAKLPKEPQLATVSTLNHEGRGVAHIEGKATFIRGALPEEEVSFTYTSKRAAFDQGLIHEVLKPSPKRVDPICQYFGVCGGCSLQHLSPEDQIQHKQSVLKELLAHHANVEPKEWLTPLLGATQAYRRSARLSVKHVFKKEKVLVGFRELNGRFIADIDSCEILDPKVGQQLPLLSKLIENLSIPQHIPQIEVTCGDNETALIFRHMKPLLESDIEALTMFGQTHKFQIYLQPKGPDTVHCIFPTGHNDRLTYQAEDVTYHFHPLDFIQVNREINIKMIKQAISLLDINKDDNVLDLFCGLGNFSLPIAKLAKSVTAIEGSQEMVERGNENASLNQLSNIHFKCANLFETSIDEKFDKILIDPPRAGAQEVIPSLNAKMILYISCNPITLARDTDLLIKRGYTLEKAGIIDMFPHTSHVESIALFTNDNAATN